jgi:hypothetical protein
MVWNWTESWPWDDRLRAYHNNLTLSSDCILLGRKMAQEGFCDHWERVSQDTSNPQSVFAKHIFDTRKVLFTTTLGASMWRNTELATGGLVDEIGEGLDGCRALHDSERHQRGRGIAHTKKVVRGRGIKCEPNQALHLTGGASGVSRVQVPRCPAGR